MSVRFNTRKLTILAQDPAVRINGNLVFAQVEIPYEDLGDGPTGYRVKVVDFDGSANVLYRPFKVGGEVDGMPVDGFAVPDGLSAPQRRAWEKRLLADPTFHSQNVYAIVMRILTCFELALGRRVEWGFQGHQLHVAPHAFLEANAYYSEDDKALLFGYFDSRRAKGRVFTCLSHDIVAHETTHAVLDGIRDGFTSPSTPDQAAFHEGFADVVALLSVFSLRETVELALTDGGKVDLLPGGLRKVLKERVSREAILASFLLGIGKEFGSSLDEEGARADCLRRSVRIEPSAHLLDSPGYEEAHARGELFAAAVLRTFVAMWSRRIDGLGTFDGKHCNLDMVVEEGARAAGHLLTMVIRALDYCPPVDLTFGAYLSALLTADTEVAPDDTQYMYRSLLRETFASFGILPAPQGTDPESGCWQPFDHTSDIVYHRNHSDSMLHDKEEVFRFLWENRRTLRIDDRGYLRVCSVRPSVRQGPDGFFVRETICEYRQVAQMFGAETMSQLGIERPEGMSTRQAYTAYGGGTLVFDEYGRIKYHIEHRLDDGARQSARLEYLWRNGLHDQLSDSTSNFSELHRNRITS